MGGKHFSRTLITVFPSDGFTAESTLCSSAEEDKLQPMSVVLFLEISSSFLETFKSRKRVIEISFLLT